MRYPGLGDGHASKGREACMIRLIVEAWRAASVDSLRVASPARS